MDKDNIKIHADAKKARTVYDVIFKDRTTGKRKNVRTFDSKTDAMKYARIQRMSDDSLITTWSRSE